MDQFPKISLAFKKACAPKLIFDINHSELKEIRQNFVKLIPDKINKQIGRMQRSHIKESSKDINLRDGSMLRLANLSNNKSKDSYKPTIKQSDDFNSSSHSLRKLRIMSSIHSELINFFSAQIVPKILRTEFCFWKISNVFLISFYLFILNI
jgi:hypothetical protein